MDRQKLESMINIVLQTDPSFIDDALSILLEPDTKVAIRKFQKKRYLRKAIEMQQQQQQQMQNQQMQQMQMQMAAQNKDKELQSEMQLQQAKNEGSLQRTLATGRVRLNEKKIDAMGRMNQ
jgi:hypothetical protein